MDIIVINCTVPDKKIANNIAKKTDNEGIL